MIEEYLKAIEMYKYLDPLENWERIIICGISHSKLAGEYVKRIVDNKFIEVVEDVFIPKWINENDWIIITSYSGNSKEILSCFSNLKDYKNVVVVASNSILEKKAAEKGIKIIKLPSGYPAKFAFPYILSSLLSIIDKNKFSEFENVVKNLKIDKKLIWSLANDLWDKEVVIYTYKKYIPVALRLKSMLNECAKMFCKVETFPDLCYNEIESLYFSYKNKTFLVIFGKDEPSLVKKQIQFVENLLVKNKNSVIKIVGDGNFIKNLVEFTLFSEYLALELAKVRGVDPFSTNNIKELKKYVEYSDDSYPY